MANGFYAAGLEAFLGGDADWDADTIKLVCIDHADDTPNLASDQDLADIVAGARVATSGAFSGKTKTGGVADASDVLLTSVVGDVFESITIYIDTTVESTSTLLVNIDTASGLPCTPDGGNITVTWDSGANRIFKL